ncbi:DNA topoisomerase 1-like [Hibiscus syriacus]|uniref:DNA topoisomerase 1-like n=1 Tax=Hibiscus syriacus TaxID=106335 RepID=UPI0019227356|nr:DNA topoisomerase 1-like [Hibiscus syriacus]
MNVDKAEPGKGKKYESSPAEQSSQNQKLDHSTNDSKSTSAAETVSHKRDTSSNSKKSPTKGEELRSQTANETTVMEKGRVSSQAAPNLSDKGKGKELTKTVKNPERSKGAEPTKTVKNPDKGRGAETPTKTTKNPDKGKGAEPPKKSVKNPEKGRGPDMSQ